MAVKIEYEADDIYVLRISGILRQSESARARVRSGGCSGRDDSFTLDDWLSAARLYF
jgi:hypothetical protein